MNVHVALPIDFREADRIVDNRPALQRRGVGSLEHTFVRVDETFTAKNLAIYSLTTFAMGC